VNAIYHLLLLGFFIYFGAGLLMTVLMAVTLHSDDVHKASDLTSIETIQLFLYIFIAWPIILYELIKIDI